MSKYQTWYDQLMERARMRDLDCYYETHHIIPRSLGGGDEFENLVDLTYREHFLAHWLLTKIYNDGYGRRAMLYAFQCMGTMGFGDRMIASWQYDVAKKVCSDRFLTDSKARVKNNLELKRKKHKSDYEDAKKLLSSGKLQSAAEFLHYDDIVKKHEGVRIVLGRHYHGGRLSDKDARKLKWAKSPNNRVH